MDLYYFIGKNESNGRIRFIVLILVGLVLMGTGLVWGFSNSFIGPTIFILGFALCLFALFHIWASSRTYFYLILAAIIMFGVFVVLHNLFDGLAQKITDMLLLRQGIEGLYAFYFTAAVLLCPAAVLAAILGFLWLKFHKQEIITS